MIETDAKPTTRRRGSALDHGRRTHPTSWWDCTVKAAAVGYLGKRYFGWPQPAISGDR